MNKRLITALALLVPFSVMAEGNCPPGMYPIGGQGAQGCAPIPGQGASGAPVAPKPSGKWETRWGALVEDQAPRPNVPVATGASVSQKSKRAAVQLATEQCRKEGGIRCELRMAYHNQCVALADPVPVGGRIPAGLTSSIAGGATIDKAKEVALSECRAGGRGNDCTVTYTACSMSEFKSF